MRPALILTAALALAACADTSEIDNAPKATVQAAVEAAPADAVEDQADNLALDASRSSIGFLGAKITGSHEGGFKAFKGTLAWTGDTPSALNVDVEMASLFADKPKLEGHLKSPDFFDVAANPAASFKAASFARVPGNPTWTVVGNMTMNGATKEISFPATFKATPEAVEAAAKFQINRQDFGIVYPGKPDDLIKDEVVLRINLLFPKA